MEGWLTKTKEGKDMENLINKIIEVFAETALFLAIIVIGYWMWVDYRTQIHTGLCFAEALIF